MHITPEQLHRELEDSRVVLINELRRESEIQRYQFRQDMEEFYEKLLKKQREEFNADVVRHMSVLAGEYQWRLATVVEKVDMTWEKCDREHGAFEQKEMTLANKVALLEEYLPTYPRNHKGTAQSSRKSEEKSMRKTLKISAKKKDH
ncbi:MAG: hypothetical protein K9M11_03105 [Candidatus Pacebacteria bacterium]|nr:hypothetical protein [Candidatus Paceibacterota bacterium]